MGNLFGSHRSTIITLYNGAFDSSSALFLVIKVRNNSQAVLMNEIYWMYLYHLMLYNDDLHPRLVFSCSCYTSLASLCAPPSSFWPPAASFTCSGLSSCCPETSFPTRCLMVTHMGMTTPHTYFRDISRVKRAQCTLTARKTGFECNGV